MKHFIPLFLLFSFCVLVFSHKGDHKGSWTPKSDNADNNSGGSNNEEAPSGSENEENFSAGTFQACDPNNRQQVCTLEYLPVCGYIHNCEGGTCTSTFGNACSACAQDNVDGYVQGACEDIKTSCDANDRPIACPLNYVPTCAVADNCQGSQCFEDTSNSCVACSMEGVAYSLPGACPSNNQDQRTYCDASNRPEVCTADYNPVCAHQANCVGDSCYFTAGNACGACADANVDWHTPGECPSEDDRTNCDADNRPEVCTADYTPVCAHRISCVNHPCFFTAGNACSACSNSNVDWHTPGECPKDDDRTFCDANDRPEVCTLDYTPVCARRISCVNHPCYYTAGNACSACSNSNVEWHTPGECPREENEKIHCDADNRPEVCTADYDPVCAHRIKCKKGDFFWTAGNACSACADDNVDWYTPGEC